jgi:DNA polymerase-4
LVVPDGAERRFLAPLAITALPDPPPELIRRLHLFAVSTLGGFAQLPHAAVVLQFGSDVPDAAALHDLARGVDPRPLAAQAPPPTVTRTLTLPDPLSDRVLVLAALERVAGRLSRALEETGYHAMALSLTILTADGQAHTTGAPVKPPSADEPLLRRMAARLLGKLSLSVAVSEVTLTAYPLREWHLGARQLTMFEPPGQLKLNRILEVLKVLRKRFGELVVRLASALGPPLPLSIQVQVREDGIPTRLRWGGWSRRVEKVYEFWRERLTWWDTPVTRDYYQVETTAGLTFTVFRDREGRWFLDRRRR